MTHPKAHLPECWCCGRRNTVHYGRGLCSGCYKRWRKRGFTGPGPGPGRSRQAENAREYAQIITRLSTSRAADRLGVTTRTITRWRATLRDAA